MQISIVKSLDVQFLSHTSTRWHSWGAKEPSFSNGADAPFENSLTLSLDAPFEMMKHVTKIPRVFEHETFEFKSPKSKFLQRKLKKVGFG